MMLSMANSYPTICTAAATAAEPKATDERHFPVPGFLLSLDYELFQGECCAPAPSQAAPAAGSTVFRGLALRPEFIA
jgi:hypothetical protein